MTPPLSPRTELVAARLFDGPERAEAERRLVEQCGNNLPFCGEYDEFQMERIRFAALRIGLGDLDALQRAIDLAQRDWRDELMWAGFGYSLEAHARWADEVLASHRQAKIIVLMGVSGAGKSTVGSMLAIRLNWMYHDADALHSSESLQKMSAGLPLTDSDRAEWLARLRTLISRYLAKGESLVLPCSALKQKYRQELRVSEAVRFVYLRGTYEQIEARLRERKGHYMKPEMLQSQFAILEEPEDALVVDISEPPQEIVAAIRKAWQL